MATMKQGGPRAKTSDDVYASSIDAAAKLVGVGEVRRVRDDGPRWRDRLAVVLVVGSVLLGGVASGALLPGSIGTPLVAKCSLCRPAKAIVIFDMAEQIEMPPVYARLCRFDSAMRWDRNPQELAVARADNETACFNRLNKTWEAFSNIRRPLRQNRQIIRGHEYRHGRTDRRKPTGIVYFHGNDPPRLRIRKIGHGFNLFYGDPGTIGGGERLCRVFLVSPICTGRLYERASCDVGVNDKSDKGSRSDDRTVDLDSSRFRRRATVGWMILLVGGGLGFCGSLLIIRHRRYWWLGIPLMFLACIGGGWLFAVFTMSPVTSSGHLRNDSCGTDNHSEHDVSRPSLSRADAETGDVHTIGEPIRPLQPHVRGGVPAEGIPEARPLRDRAARENVARRFFRWPGRRVSE